MNDLLRCRSDLLLCQMEQKRNPASFLTPGLIHLYTVSPLPVIYDPLIQSKWDVIGKHAETVDHLAGDRSRLCWYSSWVLCTCP